MSAVVLFISLADSDSSTAAPYYEPFDLFPGNVIVNTYCSISDCMGADGNATRGPQGPGPREVTSASHF